MRIRDVNRRVPRADSADAAIGQLEFESSTRRSNRKIGSARAAPRRSCWGTGRFRSGSTPRSGQDPVVTPVPQPTSATAGLPVARTISANAAKAARLDRLVVEVVLEHRGELRCGGVVSVARALEEVHRWLVRGHRGQQSAGGGDAIGGVARQARRVRSRDQPADPGGRSRAGIPRWPRRGRRTPSSRRPARCGPARTTGSPECRSPTPNRAAAGPPTESTCACPCPRRTPPRPPGPPRAPDDSPSSTCRRRSVPPARSTCRRADRRPRRGRRVGPR